MLITALAATVLTSTVLTSTGPTQPSAAATADIPPDYLRLYRAATTCPGLDWAVLAAIGKIETDHGRSTLPGVHAGENPAGAAGPMQFLAPTFTAVTARHPPPPGGSTPPSRYNPHDAIHAAAAYLCDSGAPARLADAIHAYNPSRAYVTAVLAQAARYRGTAPTNGAAAARTALEYARAQLGLPYLWGGDGPANGEPGFDCSGLTTAAYAAAGITLPRTAHTQYLAGPLLLPGTLLKPGDLLFFGTRERVHHVGIATGHGTLMINAPHRGAIVSIQDAAHSPDFLAASRPTLRRTAVRATR
ncbi:NlpC/P60 family protein [Pseudonocardia sp.]|uniref:C40 family peptidase n=1 Tax=Pseudonocardia sp. TaxID=60912 RepID=UPI003D14A1F0